MRRIDDAERRARLGVRHALAPGRAAADAVGAAESVVALHGTDPASTVLSVLARAPHLTPADVEHALYEARTLVRVLAMRRTVFAVPRDLAPACTAASDGVAGSERRKLERFLAGSGLDDPAALLARAEADAAEVLAGRDDVTTADLAAASEALATRVTVGSGTWTAEVSLPSRLLTVWSAEGRVVRARPRGGWTSSQFRWADPDRWAPGLRDLPDPDDSASRVAEAWLRRHGPATAEDLQWWSGWTTTRTRRALASLDTAEVGLSHGAGLVLADDLDVVADPDPWVALLPALDPAAMTWKHRDHLLGAHRPEVYDVNGNAGPTAWVDGRVVGGWAQRDDGEVVVELLEDVGAEARAHLDERAAHLTAVLGDVRLKARARGWTPVEKRLRA